MFKKAIAWIKEKWVALLVALGALAGLVLFSQRKRIGKLKDEIAFDHAKEEIEVLRKFKVRVLESATVEAKQIDRIDAEIQENQRALIEAHENAEGLTDEEISTEFARLGF